jgi:Tfp pilus assembly protein PilE
MIVAAILGILAMLAIPAYKGYISTGRQAAARANIEPLRIAIEDYHLDNMAAGYGALDDKKWEPTGTKDLETVLGWKPDGDQNQFNYHVTDATATGYKITVTPIGHTDDAQTFTK